MGFVWDVPCDASAEGDELGLEYRGTAESFKIHAEFDAEGPNGGLHRLWAEYPHPELPLSMLDGLIVGLLQLRMFAKPGVEKPPPLDEVLLDGVAFLLEHADEKLEPATAERVWDVLALKWDDRMGVSGK